MKKSRSSNHFSLPKKILFYTITISIPFLFFIGLEYTLRATSYFGDITLFKPFRVQDKIYLRPNPNFYARYFFYTDFIPSLSGDAFLKDKPDNGFRIFVMGGSTTAGFPYEHNATFSRVVEDVLQDAMPDRPVEVINVASSAINTYTLYDQVDEIIDQKPDAILIYAGHNEFYGALGTGSNEYLAGNPALVRLYVKLQHFRTFLLLRKVFVDTQKWFRSYVADTEVNPTATLMERIVQDRSIEWNSPIFNKTLTQFKSNLNNIITRFEEHQIPLFIGSLVSNLKDQKPFVSIQDGNYPPADTVFQEAREALKKRKFLEARKKFIYAKDLDGLKFRAPSQINRIIEQLTQETTARYVPVRETFYRSSENNIPGNELILEHLHPNDQGYFLMGKIFSHSVLTDSAFSTLTEKKIDLEKYKDKMYLSEYDKQVGWHSVRSLTQGWPFNQTPQTTREEFSYDPYNKADSLAFLTVNAGLTWKQAKIQLARYYDSKGMISEALLQYKGLIRNEPWNHFPYLEAGQLLLRHDQPKAAKMYAEKAYQLYPDNLATKKLLQSLNSR